MSDDVTVLCSETVSSSAAGSGRAHGGQRDSVVAVTGARRRLSYPGLRDRVPWAGWSCQRVRLDAGEAGRVKRHPRGVHRRSACWGLVQVPCLRRERVWQWAARRTASTGRTTITTRYEYSLTVNAVLTRIVWITIT